MRRRLPVTSMLAAKAVGGHVESVGCSSSPGQPPKGQLYWASVALAAEKKESGASRRARWFGL